MNKIDFIFSTDLVQYRESYDFMLKKAIEIAEGKSNELVWFLEHSTIFTAGTSAKDEDLLNPSMPVFKTNRGGKYTLHTKGQRVVYLMLNLKKRTESIIPDIRKYVQNLEKIIIESLNTIGIKAETKEGMIGVWVLNAKTNKLEKIAAIGIRISKGVTTHGFAININNDLNLYNNIIPCGIKQYGVCSLESLGYNIKITEFDKILLKEINKIFR